MIDAINNVKNQIYNNYYFAYANANVEDNQNIDFTDKKIRETIEDNTKNKLKSLGIHTYAKDKNSQQKFNIELSAIQDLLVIV